MGGGKQEEEERRTEGSSDSFLTKEGEGGGEGLDAPLLLSSLQREQGVGDVDGYECDESDPLPPGCWLGLAR